MANLGYVQVTRECNQHCLFCSNPPIDRRQTFENICKQIDDLADRGYAGVILTGGEPTLCEFLPQAIRYSHRRGLPARIISNGQLLADEAYLGKLFDAGLRHVHISVHSCRKETQGYLTGKEDSLSNIEKALENICKLKMKADINTVICHPNADHLDETVEWVIDRFPAVTHFVFNNIDPRMNRCEENPHMIPSFAEMELSLHRALKILQKNDLSFRVERVPLCYMVEFAAFSTETRKIVKGEERVVHFLDNIKGTVRQTRWVHGKSEVCNVCRLNPICAGLYSMNTYFDSSELYPVFLPPGPIKESVLAEH